MIASGNSTWTRKVDLHTGIRNCLSRLRLRKPFSTDVSVPSRQSEFTVVCSLPFSDFKHDSRAAEQYPQKLTDYAVALTEECMGDSNEEIGTKITKPEQWWNYLDEEMDI